MKLILFLILLVLIQDVVAQGYVNPLRKRLNKNKATPNGAVKVQLTEKGINYAASIAADMVSTEVKKTKIDDISGKKKVKYWVKNIKIDSFRKLVPHISMIPGHGMRIKLTNGALSASARWRYKKWFVSDSGSVRASVGSINLDISVNIHTDSKGRPTMKAHSCRVNLGGFSVKLRGGASFLYNLIFKAFKGKVRKTLEKSICNSATDTINNKGNKQLATLNLSSKVGKYLQLDYSLVGPPTFTGTYMETSHKGIFLNDPATSKVPLIGTPPHSMVGFSIAAEAFNGAGRVLFAKKLLKKEFEIPGIKSFIVTFDKKFANANFLVKADATAAPTISITKDIFTINLEATAKLLARMPDGSELSALVVDVTFKASASVKIMNEKIICQVKNVLPTADVKISFIGSITPQFLNIFLEQTIKLALPSINNKLNEGFPLPNVDKVKFPNAAITLHSGYLSVSSDVVYRP